jgi:uncharacterized protein
MSVQQAWYKQFWPWFLIILPLCAVVASFATLKIAMDNADALVADDYYKNGKAINMDLGRLQYAKQLGMQFSLSFDEDRLLISQHGGPAYSAALKVEFYHPTLAQKDFKLMASADGENVYRVSLTSPLEGTWEVRLASFDDRWRIQKRLDLVPDTEYWLN